MGFSFGREAPVAGLRRPAGEGSDPAPNTGGTRG